MVNLARRLSASDAGTATEFVVHYAARMMIGVELSCLVWVGIGPPRIASRMRPPMLPENEAQHSASIVALHQVIRVKCPRQA